MGNSNSESQENPEDSTTKISVLTLKYSSTYTSNPFQFYPSPSLQDISLTQVFKFLLARYFKDFDQTTFSWNFSELNKKILKSTYSPLNSQDAGIANENFKTLTRKQFINKWDSTFQEVLNTLNIEHQLPRQQVDRMRTFDLLCYHTLLLYSTYAEHSDIHSLSQEQLAKSYLGLMAQFHNKSVFDEDSQKIEKLQQILSEHQIDVLFFQNSTKGLIEYLKSKKKYYIAKRQNNASVIAVNTRNKKFKQICSFTKIKAKHYFSRQQQQAIQKSKDIVFCDDVIFICVHFSQQQQKNKAQVSQLKECLRILSQRFSSHQFVIGGNTNTYIQRQELMDSVKYLKLTVFPGSKSTITTCKKRTYLQPDFSKADKIQACCKDQLISSLKFISGCCWTFDQENLSSRRYLPTKEHPFDNFFLLGVYEKVKRKEKQNSQPLSQKYHVHFDLYIP